MWQNHNQWLSLGDRLVFGGAFFDPFFDEIDLFGGKGASDGHLSDTPDSTEESLVEGAFVGFVGDNALFGGFGGAVFVDEGIKGSVCEVEAARCARSMAARKRAAMFGKDLGLDHGELGF